MTTDTCTSSLCPWMHWSNIASWIQSSIIFFLNSFSTLLCRDSPFMYISISNHISMTLWSWAFSRLFNSFKISWHSIYTTRMEANIWFRGNLNFIRSRKFLLRTNWQKTYILKSKTWSQGIKDRSLSVVRTWLSFEFLLWCAIIWYPNKF